MRNRYVALLLLGIFSLTFVGCQEEEDDIFNGTASQRIEQKCKEINETLLSSTNGWLMNYYPDPEYSGGYNILLKFSGVEDVLMQGDSFFPSGQYPSLYAVEGTQGPVLNFNTSNEVLHKLADPSLFYIGEGMRGDIEFVWDKTSEAKDTIYFRGKKRGYSVKLVKLQDDNWDDYINKVNTNIDAFSKRFFKLVSITGDKDYVIGGYHSVNRSSYTIGIENAQTRDIPEKDNILTFTDKGLDYLIPVKFGNNLVSHFTYDAGSQKFNIADEGIQGSLENVDEPPFVFEHARDSVFYIPKGTSQWVQYLLSNPDPQIYNIMEKIRTKLYNINPKGSVAMSRLTMYNINGTYQLGVIANVTINPDSAISTLAGYMPLQYRKGTNRTDKITLLTRTSTVNGDYKDVIGDECRALTELVAGPINTGKDYIVMPNFNYSNFILGACDRNFSITINKW